MWDVLWIDKSGYAHAASFRDKTDAEIMCEALDNDGDATEIRVEYRDIKAETKA